MELRGFLSVMATLAVFMLSTPSFASSWTRTYSLSGTYTRTQDGVTTSGPISCLPNSPYILNHYTATGRSVSLNVTGTIAATFTFHATAPPFPPGQPTDPTPANIRVLQG